MKKRDLITVAIIVLVALSAASEIFAQTRIQFKKGSTSASVSGRLAPGASRTYRLAARRGQQLSANLSSRSGKVVFDDGGIGTSISYHTNSGDNYLHVVNIGQTPTTFTMTVSIR